MRYKSIVTSVFLIIPFFIVSSTTAEIFEPAYTYSISGLPIDIESADFNNDDLEDFIVLNDSTFLVPYIGGLGWYEVFLSNGDCSFIRLGAVPLDTTGVDIYHWQVLTGDFNEDGNEDFLLMNMDSKLYVGDGTGGFSEFNTYQWTAHNGCVGDLNNDGHLDIVGAPFDTLHHNPYPIFVYGDTVKTLLGDGLGGFTEVWTYYRSSTSCQLAYFGETGVDSILDLCVPMGWGFSVYQGNGDGSFAYPEQYFASAAFQYYSTCGDFNEDGYTDIAVAGDAAMSEYSTFVFLNQQDGTFLQTGEEYFYAECMMKQISTADLDLDGHLDISVVGTIAGYGDGTFNGFEYLSNGPGQKFKIADFDLDSDPDYVLITYMASDNMAVVARNTTITQGCEGETAGSIMDLVLDIAPNPFSGLVSIEVSVYSDDSENLQIFDISGRLVAELESVSSEGEAVFHWNGESSSGVELPPGIYTARLSSGNIVATASLLKLE
ncbi:MAG: T9SS type A sorting domain-containing protein [Candidatus Aegiribacteria sp.]|nr:T9SS type A sorting domain-containing protein [Candidatus Aegiribacteria sp.]